MTPPLLLLRARASSCAVRQCRHVPPWCLPARAALLAWTALRFDDACFMTIFLPYLLPLQSKLLWICSTSQDTQADRDFTMAAVELRSHTRGHLFYIPQTEPQPRPQSQSQSPRSSRIFSNLDFFTPRRSQSGRVRVKTLNASSPEPPSYQSASRKRNPTFKLAVSRESAKRFLRSVIQPPSDTSQNRKTTGDLGPQRSHRQPFREQQA